MQNMYQIKNFTPRVYQETILNTAAKANTLICLPTGRGKTKIAIMIAIHRLNNFPNSKVLFLTPTKPLAAQIAKEFSESSDISNIQMFTGEIKPEERAELFKEASVIVSTPQGMSNDIINKKVDLRKISMIVFDEAHRSTGDYDYVWIAKQYQKRGNFPRIIGLSASPGSDITSITEVCKNLHIEDIEVRTDSDEDIKPYVHETKVQYLTLELPSEFKEVQKYLNECFKEKLRVLRDLKVSPTVTRVTKTQLLQMQRECQKRLARGERHPELWQSMSLVAEAMKVQHALELFETQGLGAAFEYFKKLYKEAETTKVKATKKLVQDPNFKAAYFKISSLHDNDLMHPKLEKLIEIIKKEVKSCEKILIFNHYRDSVMKLKEHLDEIEGVKSALFVGQTKKKGIGLSQKEQIKVLEEFKEGKHNVLIGTSVGEEGIDIPAVDLIIFYEPVPSAIRTVQRRGRTGRGKEGRVIVLVTKGTRDEAYRWTAYHKENRMHRVLKDLKSKLTLQEKKQKTISEYSKQSQIKVYADSREKGCGVVKELVDLGMDVRVQNLDVGDYIVSERVACERKEVRDFVDSILDKRLMHQVRILQETYERPVIVLEGTEDIYSVRKVHPNAIRGMLAWIAVDMKIPIVHTKDYRDTAGFLMTLAKREQGEGDKQFGIRGERKPLTTKELQEYIVSGFPGIGLQLAKNLLKEFGSVKRIVNASEDELKDVEKIGKKKAEEIRRVLDEDYSGQ